MEHFRVKEAVIPSMYLRLSLNFLEKKSISFRCIDEKISPKLQDWKVVDRKICFFVSFWGHDESERKITLCFKMGLWYGLHLQQHESYE